MTARADFFAARKVIAAVTGKPVALWSQVEEPEPGTWYDYVDLETSKVGQCCKRTEDIWLQAPVGDQVVILSYQSSYQSFRRSMRRGTEDSAGAR